MTVAKLEGLSYRLGHYHLLGRLQQPPTHRNTQSRRLPPTPCGDVAQSANEQDRKQIAPHNPEGNCAFRTHPLFRGALPILYLTYTYSDPLRLTSPVSADW